MELIFIQEINFILTTRKKKTFIGNLKTAKRYKCLHESPGKKYKNSLMIKCQFGEDNQ